MAETAVDDGRESTPLAELADEVERCRACPLWEHATHGVSGQGPPGAAAMLVGEQPGDREDLAGEPFVGPAGRVLREALTAASVAVDDVYLTNAVKHFKWRQGRGKRRIHERPRIGEVMACNPWLRAELNAVQPELVVALGATAARALAGPGISVTADRGRPLESDLAPIVIVTVHPSSILRIRDRGERDAARQAFELDLAGAFGRLDELH